MAPQLVTFYSFKGGVGRTQALANLAVGLANRGLHVVVVDMDLESPGLHTFFHLSGASEPMTDEVLHDRRGVLDYVEACADLPPEEPQIDAALLPCVHPRLRPHAGRLRLLPAGTLDRDYARRVSDFSWERFYQEGEGYRYMELLRAQLFKTGADMVLLDSRTGMTDVGQICTFQLPDILVILFALHAQGIEGARRVALAVKEARDAADIAPRLRRVLLVPSRVDEYGEQALKDFWLQRARHRLEGIGDELLTDLYDRIPYLPQNSYGENIVVNPSEQNPLSNAYERLVERFVGQQALGESREAPVVSSLERFQEGLAQITGGIETVLLQWRSLVPERATLAEVTRWAFALHQHVVELRPSLDRLRLEFERWSVVAGIDTGAHGLGGKIETIEDLQAIGLRLVEVQANLKQWLEKQCQDIRRRLLQAADGDENIATPEFAPLKQLLREGHFDQIESRLEEVEARLKRTNLQAMLGVGQLARARLALSYPDAETQDRWIRGTLERIIQEGALDARSGRAIENLLRLSLESPDFDSPLYWTAYDFLCLLIKEDAERDQRVFEELGLPLWRRDWERLLDRVARDTEEIELQARIDAQQQLRRFAGEKSERHRPLARQVAMQLRNMWDYNLPPLEPARNQRVMTLFRRRHDDPILRMALRDLADRSVSPQPRRPLLAAWLGSCDQLEQERPIVMSFLLSLVEEDLNAEAFYALSALSHVDPGLPDEPESAIVELSFMICGIEKRQSRSTVDLLSYPEEIDRLQRIALGRWFLAMIGGGWIDGAAEFLPIATIIRQRLLYHSIGGDPFPGPILEWFRHLEHFADAAVGSTSKIEALVGRLDDYQSARFYAGWIPSTWYEEDFHRLVAAWTERLRGETRPRDDLNREIDDLDAHRWVGDSFNAQKDKGRKTSYPEPKGLKPMLDTFHEFKQTLHELNACRPPEGNPTIGRILELEQLRSRARQALHNSIEQGCQESAFPGLAARIIALMQSET